MNTQTDTQFNTIQLKEKIAALQNAILTVHPTLPIILKDIHTLLKSDPSNITLLDEDDISTIVSGLKKQTATEITQATLKKSTKSLSKVSLDDL
jgi:hypothetical protein